MKKVVSMILAIALLAICAFSLTSCSGGSCEYFGTRDTEGRKLRYAKITFEDYGEVYLLLDETTAPITVRNFLRLANDDFYDGLTMHRVISDFMIQGGDPNGDGTGGSETEIIGEFSENHYEKNDLKHLRGVISMARGEGKNSASSQFFICTADSPNLDGEYAAFGYVIAGMNVVDKISDTTVVYAVGDNGAIPDASKRAVIASVDEITEEEALRAAR